MTAGECSGIPAEAFEFYDALQADPTKSWWLAHKQDYLNDVRGPLASLGAALTEEFGEPHLYRPYRDVRFSRDKSPYKDHQGMFVEATNGLGWYLQISASSLMVAGGWYVSSPAQVARYRDYVARDEEGVLARQLVALRERGFTVAGDQLKTRPRGVPADHPRVEELRYRTLYAHRSFAPDVWMGTPAVVSRVREQWRELAPLCARLAEIVGPGDAPTSGSRAKSKSNGRSGGQDGL